MNGFYSMTPGQGPAHTIALTAMPNPAAHRHCYIRFDYKANATRWTFQRFVVHGETSLDLVTIQKLLMRIDGDQRQALHGSQRPRINTTGRFDNPFALLDSFHALHMPEAIWDTRAETYVLLHQIPDESPVWKPKAALNRLTDFLKPIDAATRRQRPAISREAVAP